MAHRSREDRVLPRDAVVLEKPLAGDETEMQMKVHQLAAGFVITQEAHHGGMIAAAHRGEELQPPLQQEGLDAMLILTRDEQVEVSLAGQHQVDASAALPIAVGDVLTFEIVQNLQQQRQDVFTCLRVKDRIDAVGEIHLRHASGTLALVK